jgi:hypothetical protein
LPSKVSAPKKALESAKVVNIQDQH